MDKNRNPILWRLGQTLQDREEEITHEPLPKRWVDLIHRLNELERDRNAARQKNLRGQRST